MFSPSRLLANAWLVLASFFAAFTLWAFYVQIENDNSLIPGVGCAIMTVVAVVFAWVLRRYLEHNPSRLTQWSALTVFTALPWVVFWAYVAEADDAPGALLLALGFLILACLGAWALFQARRVHEGKSLETKDPLPEKS